MTRIKLCGLSRPRDIETANDLMPDYIGFVFAPKSRRYVTPDRAAELKALLNPRIKAVGVFVDEEPDMVAAIDAIDIIQLHGKEDETYIARLRRLTSKPIIKAFKAPNFEGVNDSSADMILLDSGAGTGKTFDWNIIKDIRRPYFLAGGLDPANVAEAIGRLRPHGVDVSGGIETDGFKDKEKAARFVAAVRKEDNYD